MFQYFNTKLCITLHCIIVFLENLNRTVAKFDVQFTLSEHTQQKFSSALASLETAQTKLSKSIDGEIYSKTRL